MESGIRENDATRIPAGTCTVCSCFGVKIAIHWTFLEWVVTFVICNLAYAASSSVWIYFTIALLLNFWSTLIHELGRCSLQNWLGARFTKRCFGLLAAGPTSPSQGMRVVRFVFSVQDHLHTSHWWAFSVCVGMQWRMKTVTVFGRVGVQWIHV